MCASNGRLGFPGATGSGFGPRASPGWRLSHEGFLVGRWDHTERCHPPLGRPCRARNMDTSFPFRTPGQHQALFRTGEWGRWGRGRTPTLNKGLLCAFTHLLSLNSCSNLSFTHPGSHSQETAELGFEPRSVLKAPCPVCRHAFAHHLTWALFTLGSPPPPLLCHPLCLPASASLRR